MSTQQVPENLEQKRWWIAVAAVIMQLCLGTVYAWSVFKNPLKNMFGWQEVPIQLTFTIIMVVIATSAAFGGILVDKYGPRKVATLGGILFGIGTLVAGLSAQIGNIWLLYLGFGVIAGIGNGFGYVTPIATLIRWFPDKRGLVTGLAVMGFGAGAVFMGQLAPIMINKFDVKDAAGKITETGVGMTWYIWGVIFLILVVLAAQMFKNPPKGWMPKGFVPKAGSASSAAESFNMSEAIRTPAWWMLWAMLGLNISAGLGLLSQLSPMAQRLMTDSSAAEKAILAGTVVAIASIFNGLGRLFWAWLSDLIGRKNVFIAMFASQALVYALLPTINSHFGSIAILTIIASYLLACYGGGFATMPAFAADAFGPANIGRVYGTMLTAWGVAGVIGPMAFAALGADQALYTASGLLILGLIVTLIYKRPTAKA
jgi:OFA family oxalate/formate antiporter-like MFS transporter